MEPLGYYMSKSYNSRQKETCKMTKLAGYRVDGCKGCGKAYLVGESHDRSKCAECAGK